MSQRVFSVLSKRLQQKVTLNKLGEMIVKIVKKRTKRGYGVSAPEGDQKKLKRLSKRYIKWRRKIPNLHMSTSPSKSNLTLTGKMLDSLGFKRLKTGVKITLSPKQYKKMTEQENQGRMFATLSRREINKIKKELGKELHITLKKKSS